MRAISTLGMAFTQPVMAAQAHFRGLLAAMAEPGTVRPLTAELPAAPPPLSPAIWALLLTLADYETPVWLPPSLAGDAVGAALRFHAGAPLAAGPDGSALAVLPEPAAALPLSRFAIGQPDYPDRSTTLLIVVAGFTAATRVRLTGPGIEHHRIVGIDGADRSFWTACRDNHACFPQGVDIAFVAPAGLMALPRSTSVELI